MLRRRNDHVKYTGWFFSSSIVYEADDLGNSRFSLVETDSVMSSADGTSYHCTADEISGCRLPSLNRLYLELRAYNRPEPLFRGFICGDDSGVSKDASQCPRRHQPGSSAVVCLRVCLPTLCRNI
jgi:hypothetical protein